MSQQISDLVINLDVDSVSFAEQIPRIKNQLKGMADAAEASSQRMARFEARQAEALKQLSSASAQATTDMQQKNAAATLAMENDWQKTAQSVEDTHQRVEALSRQLAENKAKSAETARQQDQMTSSFYQQIDAVNRLSTETQSLTVIQAKLRQARAQGTISQQDYLALLTRTTERQREFRLEEERATAARDKFIQQLKFQADTQKLSNTELLEYKAAQLGATNQASPFIAKLREQERSLKTGALSAGQYRQAMRMLPAQITDIATSLAGGMPIWLVAIQQGGQIKDSFGGAGNSVKALTSLITPARLAIGGLAGSAGILAYAWYKGSQEGDEFNRQIILTGNYAGKTVGQLQDMARALSGNGITQQTYAGVLAKVVGTGSFNGEQFSAITKAAAEMEKATGQSVDETIKQFQNLQKDPVNAIKALNDSMHFLTAKQYEQISAAQIQGDSQRAAALATQAYADAVINRTNDIANNLGTLESAWNWVKGAASGAWDSMLGVGRSSSSAMKRQDAFNDWQNAKKEADTLARNLKGDPNYNGSNSGQRRDAERVREARARELAMKQAYELADKEAAAEGLKAERERLYRQSQDGAIKGQQELNQLIEKGLTPAEKRAKAEEKLNKLIKQNKQDAKDGIATLWTDKDIAKARAGIEKEFKDPKTPKGKGYVTPAGDRAEDSAQRDLLSLQSQLSVLKQHQGINDTISQQRKELWNDQAKFSVLEEASRTRQLSLQEKSLLSSKSQVLELSKQKALLGDQIVAQEQLNKRMDAAQKYVTQMAEKEASLNVSATMSDRMAGRESVYAQLRSGWKNSGGSLDDAGFKKQLDAAKGYFASEDALRSNWKAGAKKSWAEYSDSATNTYEQMRSVGASTLNGLSSQLTSVLTSGKSSFKDFTASILSMLTEILVKMQLVNGLNSLSQAFGWNIKANANGGIYNSASLSAYSGSVVDKPTFFAFAKGGGVMGEAGPEAILPLRRGANGKLGVVAGNAGGGSPVFHNTIILQSDGTATSKTSGGSDAMSQAMMKMLDKFCQDNMLKALRPGGLLFNAMNTR